MTRSPVCRGVVLAAPTLLAVPERREFSVTSPVVERMAETGCGPDWVVVTVERMFEVAGWVSDWVLVMAAEVGTVGAPADAPSAALLVVVITKTRNEMSQISCYLSF